MKSQIINIARYDWVIKVVHNPTKDDLPIIEELLNKMQADAKTYEDIESMIINEEPNTAIACSNKAKKFTVIIFGKTTSKAEYINSLVHELIHVSNHITKALNMEYNNEELVTEIGYVAGDIVNEMLRVEASRKFYNLLI